MVLFVVVIVIAAAAAAVVIVQQIARALSLIRRFRSDLNRALTAGALSRPVVYAKAGRISARTARQRVFVKQCQRAAINSSALSVNGARDAAGENG